MIFANHAHVYPAELRESGRIERLLEMLDACAIDKAVALAPFPDRFRESALFCDRNPNDWLAQTILPYSDRLVGFGTVDVSPDAPPIREQVRRIHALGFRGIKLHPAAQEFAVNGKTAYEIYSAAQELDLFLSFHTGLHWHPIRDYNMLLFDDVVWDFPSLRMSFEHVGGFSFFRDALLVMCNNNKNPHTFAGLTSVEPDESGLCGPWSLTDEDLQTLIFQTGEDRTIFGLDFPFKNIDYVRRAMARIRALPVSDTAKQNILGNTLHRQLFPTEGTT